MNCPVYHVVSLAILSASRHGQVDMCQTSAVQTADFMPPLYVTEELEIRRRNN